MFRSVPSMLSTTFNVTTLAGYRAGHGTITGGATATNAYGFWVDSSHTGATNNYGFYSDVTAAANRWNFFANGTAQNYFAGNVGIGSGKTVPSTALDVNGTITSTATSINGVGLVYSATATTTSMSQVALTSVAIATYRVLKCLITATSAGAYHYTEVTLLHDGTNVNIVENGTIMTGASLATFSADMTGGMRLLIAPTSANSTTFKAIVTAIVI
jgi:hypothetical protein